MTTPQCGQLSGEYRISTEHPARQIEVCGADNAKCACILPTLIAGLDRKPISAGVTCEVIPDSWIIMTSPPVLPPGNMHPFIPASLAFAPVHGRALVRAKLLPGGQVGEVFIDQSSGSQVLDQAALDTVRSWHFKPPKFNGDPAPVWINIPIEY